MGWATAWSFDRLRLWLERGSEPRAALLQTLIHGVARVALAAVFAYQGLVPKLFFPHPDEMSMMEGAGVAATQAATAVAALGLAELAVAVALLSAWSRSWPLWLCLIAMPAATATVALSSPAVFAAAFNPFALNVSVAALAAIGLLVLPGVPSARRCLRRPARSVP
jgi:hypothetical protein